MRSRLAQLIDLRPGEWQLALSFCGLLTISTLMSELADVVATAGFVSQVGPREVPWLWLADMVVTITLAGIYTVVVDRTARVHLMSWLFAGLTILYLTIQFLFSFGAPVWLTYPLLYVVADQQYVFFPLAFWALANDLYTAFEARRLFPLIGVGYTLGALLGNLSAAVATVMFASTVQIATPLIAVCTILSVIGFVTLTVVFYTHPIHARQERTEVAGLRATVGVGLEYFRHVPTFFYLGLIILLVHITRTILQYHFLSVIKGITLGTVQFQALYGTYNVGLIIGVVVFQILIASRLLKRIQLRGSFWVLPAVLMIAVGTAFFLPGWPYSALGFFLVLLTEEAWDVPARKALQNLVPDERRGRVSTFFDTYFYSAATVVGCLFLVGLMALAAGLGLSDQMVIRIYLGVGALTAVGAIWAAFRLRATYNKSLLNWRLARSRRSSVVDERGLLEKLSKKGSSAP